MNQLHRSIPNAQLPKVLREKLVFGNRPQIEAMDSLNADIDRWIVNIHFEGIQAVSVEAQTEEEACEKARELADAYDIEMTISGIVAIRR